MLDTRCYARIREGSATTTPIHRNSSDSEPVSVAALSPVQARVVTALARGDTITAAALEAGVHRTTIHHWFRNEPEFKTAVQCAEREYRAILNDRMSDLAARALETLRSLLDDPNTPPAIRLKAALAVLQRPQFPERGWALPERIESQREKEFMDSLAEIEVEYRAMRISEALESSARRSGQQPSAPPARSAPCPVDRDGNTNDVVAEPLPLPASHRRHMPAT